MSKMTDYVTNPDKLPFLNLSLFFLLNLFNISSPPSRRIMIIRLMRKYPSHQLTSLLNPFHKSFFPTIFDPLNVRENLMLVSILSCCTQISFPSKFLISRLLLIECFEPSPSELRPPKLFFLKTTTTTTRTTTTTTPTKKIRRRNGLRAPARCAEPPTLSADGNAVRWSHQDYYDFRQLAGVPAFRSISRSAAVSPKSTDGRSKLRRQHNSSCLENPRTKGGRTRYQKNCAISVNAVRFGKKRTAKPSK